MEDVGENPEGPGGSISCGTTVAYAELVSLPDVNDNGSPDGFFSDSPPLAQQAQGQTSLALQAETCSNEIIRRSLAEHDICEDAENIIMASWRPQTRKRYAPTIKKWISFSLTKIFYPLHPPVGQVINFLTKLYKEGGKYRSICLARSAINSVIKLLNHKDLDKHPLVSRFLKGVHNSRPPLMKQQTVWDPRILLRYIDKMGDNDDLNLKQLTYKTVALVMLLSGSRVHCIHAFSTDCMHKSGSNAYTFYPTVLLKHSRPKFRGKPITYRAYPNNNRLCVIKALEDYIWRRDMITETDSLFITHRRPHRPASKDTIARWLKDALTEAGIDNYTAHSFRSASTSLAFCRTVSIKEIMEQGQWTQHNTWSTYYKKELSVYCISNRDNFATQILTSI